MKKLLFLMAALAIVSCAKEQDMVQDVPDELVEVIIPVGIGNETSKVWAGWSGTTQNNLWSAGDTLGIFAGDDNDNCKFTLVSGENTTSAAFKGKMAKVLSPVVLYAYSPFDPEASMDNIPFPSLQNQVFEGSYEEKGSFTNYGKYALMLGMLDNFTLDTQWPASAIHFNVCNALLRFKIVNNTTRGLQVGSVQVDGVNYDNPFRLPKKLVATQAGLSYTYQSVSAISVAIPDDNRLNISKDETKYVQMVAFENEFQNDEQIAVYVRGINSDGIGVEHKILKNVTSAQNFQRSKRTTFNLTLTDATVEYTAYNVKIKTNSSATSITAPIFDKPKGFTDSYSWWGDGINVKYQAGQPHQFVTAGVEHTSIFGHWGASNSVTIESLENIKEIDFSDVF